MDTREGCARVARVIDLDRCPGVHFRSLVGVQHLHAGVVGLGVAGLVGPVDPLVLVPVGDADVPLPIEGVASDKTGVRKPRETLASVAASLARVVLKSVQLGRDQLVAVDADAVVIDVRPQPDEGQPGSDGQSGDRLALPELGLDTADTCHGRPSGSIGCA